MHVLPAQTSLRATADFCEGSGFQEGYQNLGHQGIQFLPHASICFGEILTKLKTGKLKIWSITEPTQEVKIHQVSSSFLSQEK